jgi:hypothetical protein
MSVLMVASEVALFLTSPPSVNLFPESKNAEETGVVVFPNVMDPKE